MKMIDEIANWITVVFAAYTWPAIAVLVTFGVLAFPAVRRPIFLHFKRLPFLPTLHNQFDVDPGNGRIAAKWILKQPTIEGAKIMLSHHKGSEIKTSEYCPQFAFAAQLAINGEKDAAREMIENIDVSSEMRRANAEISGDSAKSETLKHALSAACEEFFEWPLRRAELEPNDYYQKSV